MSDPWTFIIPYHPVRQFHFGLIYIKKVFLQYNLNVTHFCNSIPAPSNGISPYSLLINHVVSHHFIQSNMCVMTLETLKETRLLFIYLLKTLSINSSFWYDILIGNLTFFSVHSWRRHSYVVIIKIIVMSNYKTGLCTQKREKKDINIA